MAFPLRWLVAWLSAAVVFLGLDAGLWKRRWRLFFLAVAGLFGDSGGEVWGVSHYRLAPAR